LNKEELEKLVQKKLNIENYNVPISKSGYKVKTTDENI